MRVVYIPTFKPRLSEFLRLVKSGETILVTEQGRPVALLAPVAQNPPLGEAPSCSP